MESIPILYNALKHHQSFVEDFIHGFEGDEIQLKKDILCIGDSLMDLYTGTLTIENIEQEVLDQLECKNTLESKVYEKWLKSNMGFQTLKLSDQSEWVLRLGLEKDKYVHIHPARYAVNTIRVKATALKTSIAVVIFIKKEKVSFSLELLNQIRVQQLDLSPIKKIAKNGQIDTLLRMFSVDYLGSNVIT